VKTNQRDYDALHKMLMILEDKDPTLRLSARSWLQDSKSDFSLIIDPLLKEFMSNNKMFRSFTGQLFYVEKYNANYVKENFTKLRNIILTTQEDFVKYICLNNYSDYIKDEFGKVVRTIDGVETGEEGSHRPAEVHQDFSERYIVGIVYLTLQFIMGQYVECMDEELYQETQIVNASACEFMELVIRSISHFNDLCTDIIHLIIDRLVQTLRVAIESNNDAQQVILLNLLKVILFEHEKQFISPHSQETDRYRDRQRATAFFEDKSFFKCFTDGLRSQSAFVRYHFIQFVQKLVPLMQKVIDRTKLVEHVESLINCFCELLELADVSAYESNQRAGRTLIGAHDLEDDDFN